MTTMSKEDEATIKEATTLIDDLTSKIEYLRKLHSIGTWHEDWADIYIRNRSGYDHVGCTHCEVNGKCDTLLVLEGVFPYDL